MDVPPNHGYEMSPGSHPPMDGKEFTFLEAYGISPAPPAPSKLESANESQRVLVTVGGNRKTHIPGSWNPPKALLTRHLSRSAQNLPDLDLHPQPQA